MQFKLFTIPVFDNDSTISELNSFLRSHRVIECTAQLASHTSGTFWCFCVKYVESEKVDKPNAVGKKVDYKELLDERTFKVFTRLREIRKQIAATDAIPAYAVCTDQELASMAQLPEITKSGLLSVRGFGEKKFEKFGVRIIESWLQTNETHR